MKPTRFYPPCTLDEFLSVFFYDRDGGRFLYRRDSSPRHHNAGLVAGRVMSSGHVRIRVFGQYCFAHRMVWFVENGVMPSSDIDHIDGQPANNRISNLRLSSCAQNNHNRRIAVNNTSGRKGVYWHKPSRKWRAKITAHGKTFYLGLFSTVEEAGIAYANAALKHHGDFARVA